MVRCPILATAEREAALRGGGSWQICHICTYRASVTLRHDGQRGIENRFALHLESVRFVRQRVAPTSIDRTKDASLAQAMTRAAEVVEQALDVLLPDTEGMEGRLGEAMRYATLGGGKRMRAFLVMESAALFGVAETSAARVAASVEMLHAYSLVHDDLPAMDDDDLRRGKPSTHKAFDEATAILAGDALQTRAFEILAESDTHSDPQARCELVAALGAAAGAKGMAGGQMIDMVSEGQELSATAVTRLQALKTGRLIQYSAEAGAILGRASSQQRHLLAAYGRDLGAAFQIADDILDIEGSVAEIGKTAGKDQAAGKATMVAVLGAEMAKAHAEMLARQAADHLRDFGDRADTLRALAAFVVARRS
jgi:farnesyl diphosphate synthase